MPDLTDWNDNEKRWAMNDTDFADGWDEDNGTLASDDCPWAIIDEGIERLRKSYQENKKLHAALKLILDWYDGRGDPTPHLTETMMKVREMLS